MVGRWPADYFITCYTVLMTMIMIMIMTMTMIISLWIWRSVSWMYYNNDNDNDNDNDNNGIYNSRSWLVLRASICHVIGMKITWVSNYSCPIWTFCNRTPVIGYPRDFHANYARLNGFLSNAFYSFQNLGKALQTFSLKKIPQKTFFPKFVIDTIN